MIDPTVYAIEIGKLADRFNRALLPPTAHSYYAQLSPVLSTEEFVRACQLVLRDEDYYGAWPAPRVFVEKVRSNAPAQYRALPAGTPHRQFFPGFPFERDEKGDFISHGVVCACGRKYEQYELLVGWMEKLSEGARRAMLAEFPIGRCPTECPACARKILATGISYPERPRQHEPREFAA